MVYSPPPIFFSLVGVGKYIFAIFPGWMTQRGNQPIFLCVYVFLVFPYFFFLDKIKWHARMIYTTTVLPLFLLFFFSFSLSANSGCAQIEFVSLGVSSMQPTPSSISPTPLPNIFFWRGGWMINGFILCLEA